MASGEIVTVFTVSIFVLIIVTKRCSNLISELYHCFPPQQQT
jgi:hypothetical protein